MSMWSNTLETLKKMGMSRGLIKTMYGRREYKYSEGRQLPKGYRAKRKRLQKIQKESRRRNRA